MGIAMFTVSSPFAPLHGLLSWFMPASPHLAPAARNAQQCGRQSARASVASVGKVQQAARTCTPRPLRVLRVVEGNAPASAGRMVISGRMADVCAELDRLAALEATRH
jgi:hypothetical protein